MKLFTGVALVIGLAVTAATGAAAANGGQNITCHSNDILEGTSTT